MGVMLDTIGQLIAGYLQKEVPGYEPFTPSDPEHLRGVIARPADADRKSRRVIVMSWFPGP